jgi:hypothetical protein
MTSIENYKSKMSLGLKTFFENYEPHIKRLIEELNSKKLLEKTSFKKEDIERLTDIFITSNAALGLINDFNRIITKNPVKTEENIKKLGEAGWKIDPRDRIGYQYYVILSLNYHFSLERLKNYFISFIDWNSIGKNPEIMHGIEPFLKELKIYSPNNDFLNYFDSGIRNSIAHFTFFGKMEKLIFARTFMILLQLKRQLRIL